MVWVCPWTPLSPKKFWENASHYVWWVVCIFIWGVEWIGLPCTKTYLASEACIIVSNAMDLSLKSPSSWRSLERLEAILSWQFMHDDMFVSWFWSLYLDWKAKCLALWHVSSDASIHEWYASVFWCIFSFKDMDLPLDVLNFLSGILRECKPFEYLCMMICLYVGSGICGWIVNEIVLHFNMFLLMHLCSLMIWLWPWRLVICIWKLDNEKPIIYICIYIYVCILLLESIEKRIV